MAVLAGLTILWIRLAVDPIYYASENELKKEVISLRIRNKELSSETEKVSLRLKEFQEKDKRFSDLFKVIQERTRPGTEDVILHKLNQFYNGVYDKWNRQGAFV